jgi:hypothetical protein
MPITTTPSGGPQGEFSTYTPIYSTVLSETTSTVILSNIPTNFTDLELVMQTKSNGGYASLILRFNSDSSSLYSQTYLQGNGTASGSGRDSGTGLVLSPSALGISSNEFTDYKVSLMNYSNVTTNKTILFRNGAGNQGTQLQTGLYRSTNPLTSLTLNINSGVDFVSGSTFTLYGIKAAEATYIPVNSAGGDYAVSDGTYVYHVFKSSGIFSPRTSLSCDVLVVAGGGGGGTTAGGGGGAGGLRLLTSQTVSTTTAVTIGAGGNGRNNQASYLSAPSGTLTSFGSIAVSGGGGGGNDAGTGRNGGSGGGGGGSSIGTHLGGSGNAGGYTPVEGYGGGNSTSSAAQYAAPGGGGAGGAGNNNPNSNTGGAGGVGTNTYNSNVFTSWLTATKTGVGGYLAGGGGGGIYSAGTSGGAGGIGGGGTGGGTSSSYGANGTPNTGSGAGGGRPGGGNGGSGLVIVRYAL